MHPMHHAHNDNDLAGLSGPSRRDKRGPSRRLPWIHLAVLFLVAWVHAGEELRVLDLTAFVPPEGTPAGWGGSAQAFVTGRSFTISSPLRLSLVNLTPDAGRPGDSFVYEASIRNIGSYAVQIPWSPDWKSVQEGRETPPAGYLAAWLSLFAEDDAGQKRRLAEHLLYGSRRTAGSIVELAPGDEVRFRAPGLWPSVEGAVGGEVKLRVQVQFTFLFGPAELNAERQYISEPRTIVLSPAR